MPKLAVIISPNWRDYGEKYLPACMASLRQQTRPADRIYLLDNESSDQSLAFLKSVAPEGEVIRFERNAGFAETNNAAMASAIEAGYDFIVLLNIDTVSDPGALAELERAALAHPEAGAIQARLMLWQDKAKLNSIGNATHFLGFGFCEGYNQVYEGLPSDEASNRPIFYPSGAAVMFRASTLRKVGLFDESYWMYAEDQDLGWRIWLAGEECRVAETAVVYHNYEFSRSIAKYYWMDRNRMLVMLKNYHWLTLCIIAPAFLLMECGQLLFAAKSGWLKEKLAVYAYFTVKDNWRRIIESRRQVQAMRVARDRQLKKLLASKIEYQEIASLPLRIANVIFTAYWQIVRLLIIW